MLVSCVGVFTSCVECVALRGDSGKEGSRKTSSNPKWWTVVIGMH